MKIVIQCAGTKDAHAGHMRTRDGRQVAFVARPDLAPRVAGFHYARPDDPADGHSTWRDLLVAYNERPNGNPLGLLPAVELYANAVYRDLASRFGVDSVFILSAGWGLLSGSFLTPAYDITFSAAAEPFARRRRGDHFNDFPMSPQPDEQVVFFGGKDYAPLFAQLTNGTGARRIVFYNSRTAPDLAGCETRHFETRTRTNWHYECARAFLNGDILV